MKRLNQVHFFPKIFILCITIMQYISTPDLFAQNCTCTVQEPVILAPHNVMTENQPIPSGAFIFLFAGSSCSQTYTVTAEGLPPGVSIDTPPQGGILLKGTPTQHGLYYPTFNAEFAYPDCSGPMCTPACRASSEQTFKAQILVLPSTQNATPENFTVNLGEVDSTTGDIEIIRKKSSRSSNHRVLIFRWKAPKTAEPPVAYQIFSNEHLVTQILGNGKKKFKYITSLTPHSSSKKFYLLAVYESGALSNAITGKLKHKR